MKIGIIRQAVTVIIALSTSYSFPLRTPHVKNSKNSTRTGVYRNFDDVNSQSGEEIDRPNMAIRRNKRLTDSDSSEEYGSSSGEEGQYSQEEDGEYYVDEDQEKEESSNKLSNGSTSKDEDIMGSGGFSFQSFDSKSSNPVVKQNIEDPVATINQMNYAVPPVTVKSTTTKPTPLATTTSTKKTEKPQTTSRATTPRTTVPQNAAKSKQQKSKNEIDMRKKEERQGARVTSKNAKKRGKDFDYNSKNNFIDKSNKQNNNEGDSEDDEKFDDSDPAYSQEAPDDPSSTNDDDDNNDEDDEPVDRYHVLLSYYKGINILDDYDLFNNYNNE